MNISIITFTENGTKLAEKIRQAFVGTKMEEAKKLGLSRNEQAPIHIGYGVVCDDFIISSGSNVD